MPDRIQRAFAPSRDRPHPDPQRGSQPGAVGPGGLDELELQRDDRHLLGRRRVAQQTAQRPLPGPRGVGQPYLGGVGVGQLGVGTSGRRREEERDRVLAPGDDRAGAAATERREPTIWDRDRRTQTV